MKIASLFAALMVASVGLATADDNPGHQKTVVELFTSQGCSSCPPADALLAALGEREDVLALAYHVDYWDYIGWEDSFASPEFSALQKEYARSLNKMRVYTPQAVVNGSQDIVGSDVVALERAIGQADAPVNMLVTCSDTMIEVSIPDGADLPAATLWLVSYIDEADVEIERGENRGKTLTYTHIVLDRQAVGMAMAGENMSVRLPLRDLVDDRATGIALILQQDLDGLPGKVLASGAVDL